MTNIEPGAELSYKDRNALRKEMFCLKIKLDQLYIKDVYTNEYTPWERVEHSAEICGISHDIEAIEMSLKMGRRIY